MTIKQGKVVRLPIDEVIPYWRNPRRVTGEAVEAIAASIEEYGYQQPIVVDAKKTIIIGHTRYTAMRRLGHEEIDVMVVDYLTEQQVKQLRIIDNRSAEYTSWDLDMLLGELEKADSELMKRLFSDVLPSGGGGEVDVDLSKYAEAVVEEKPTPATSFVCPSCFHPFQTVVTHDDVLRGRIEPREPA